MMSNRSNSLNVASALAGAVALASLATPAGAATPKGMEACYGIAAAGQNSCASASGNHACAGESTVAFSGEEYRIVKQGTCEHLGGKLKPFKGIDTEAQKMAGKPMKM
jgi:uncharacterized membrane protein